MLSLLLSLNDVIGNLVAEGKSFFNNFNSKKEFYVMWCNIDIEHL